jgi:Putative auto-transporter adhesin, head GIN domain
MGGMRTSLLTLCALISTVAFAHEDGNGKLTTVTREAAGFQGVALEVPIRAEIQRGDFAVSIRTDSNLQSSFRVTVEGGRLLVECDDDVQPSRDSVVEIRLPALSELDQRGAGDVRIRGIQSEALRLSLSGAGDILFDGSAARLHTSLSGAGRIRLDLRQETEKVVATLSGTGNIEFGDGRARSIEANVSGMGKVEARKLVATSGEFSVSGVGGIETTLDGGSAEFRVSGIGSIEWWGDAHVQGSESSGLGGVHHRG